MIRIEPGRPEDVAEVRRLATEVFASQPAYGRLLPGFFSTQGVHSFLAWEADRAVGFILLGFLPWSGGDRQRDWWVAEILAVAVAADRRRRGIGRGMMERLIALVEQMGEWRDLKQIELSCAADNAAALAFFERFGFGVIDRHHGAYADGRTAWRLALERQESDGA